MGDPTTLTQRISLRLSSAITMAKGAGSMAALARRITDAGCEVREQELARWKDGPRKGYPIPDLNRLPALAECLGVSLAWLVLGIEDAPQKASPPEQKLSARPAPASGQQVKGASLGADKKRRAGG